MIEVDKPRMIGRVLHIDDAIKCARISFDCTCGYPANLDSWITDRIAVRACKKLAQVFLIADDLNIKVKCPIDGRVNMLQRDCNLDCYDPRAVGRARCLKKPDSTWDLSDQVGVAVGISAREQELPCTAQDWISRRITD